MADIKGTLFNITRNLTKTSGDLVKTTKLSVSLAQEQEAQKALYMEIGKKVHEIYQYGGSLGKFFDEKYHEIEAAERKIDALKEEIAKIKGVKECPKCGKQVDKNAEFCPKCGLRLDGVAPIGEGPEARPAAPQVASSASPPLPEAPAGHEGTPSYPSAPAEPPTPPYPAKSAAPSAPPFPPESAVPYAPPFPPESAAPSAPPFPPESSAPSMPPLPPAHPVAAAVRCRVCGAENDPGTKFCLSCGRIL